MATIEEMERRIEVYKTINRELTQENKRLKDDLYEQRSTIVVLNRELAVAQDNLALLRQSVTEIVTNTTSNLGKMQNLISLSAGSLSSLIERVLPAEMYNQQQQSSAKSSAGFRRSGGDSRNNTPNGTPLRRVNPTIRTPYGSVVQNFSIRLPRLSEAAIVTSRSPGNTDDASELENTATSLYSEEDEMPPVVVQKYNPVRSAVLEERFDEVLSSEQPSTSRQQPAEPQPGPSNEEQEQLDGLPPILEESETTQNSSSQDDDLETSIDPIRLSPSNKENTSPVHFSMSACTSSTPLAVKFLTSQRDFTEQSMMHARVVLPRITNIREFSQQNNVRYESTDDSLNNEDEGALSLAATQQQPPPEEVKKRKKVAIEKQYQRPKRSRPAPGSMVEPSTRKKLRRSK